MYEAENKVIADKRRQRHNGEGGTFQEKSGMADDFCEQEVRVTMVTELRVMSLLLIGAL